MNRIFVIEFIEDVVQQFFHWFGVPFILTLVEVNIICFPAKHLSDVLFYRRYFHTLLYYIGLWQRQAAQQGGYARLYRQYENEIKKNIANNFNGVDTYSMGEMLNMSKYTSLQKELSTAKEYGYDENSLVSTIKN